MPSTVQDKKALQLLYQRRGISGYSGSNAAGIKKRALGLREIGAMYHYH